ncbi:hypothetical protein DM558_05715 [Entomomonas moraniae]|uniref:Saccharopine dehydrogenase NADP binding domain-containing protein n=1 Tax=Entomomonas moraniae TaxID=2213226 RepID=A0A3Q9JM30_9GAMM|nr:hypothetical protein [Entomomonas moraniae]AZS50302.1 hypothetical protein DM558_05715 [Entomomonas moraniae]
MTTSQTTTTKIIVIGGTGETGQRILNHLKQTYPTLSLTCASRQNTSNLSDIPFVNIDISNAQQSIALLKDYDLAILAIGPMERLLATPHQLCLEACIDCIDINDSATASKAILGLHETAQQKQCSIYTGMGLAPGITTLMLMQLAEKKRSSKGVYRSRLYMGAAYGGGKTSPYSMLANFSKKLTVFQEGKLQTITTPWKKAPYQFHFFGQEKPLAMLPYGTPEVISLSSERFDQATTPIRTLDSRFHIQFFPMGMAKAIAAFNPGEKTINFLANKFYNSGQSIKNKPKADPDTYINIFPDNAPEQGLMLQGSISSYDLTALMTCAVTDCWLNNNLVEKHGVYSIEFLSSATRNNLTQALKARGIIWQEYNTSRLQAENNYFGSLESNIYKVQTLRHYGKNWYTVPKQHPRMAYLQKHFLFQSEVWQTLRKQLNTLQLTKFIIKMLKRWQKHGKQLAHYAEKSSEWKKLTKDLSMFTSGYSLLRETIGQQLAYSHYRKMFLETGDMEMQWLWPQPTVFMLLENPAQAVYQYWLAFLESYQQLGLLNFSQTKLAVDSYHVHINQCIYAEVFTKLGCPELANLVREMEHYAFTRIASKTNLVINWQQKDNGETEVSLTIPPAILTQTLG